MEHIVNMLETMSDNDQTKRSISQIQHEQWRNTYIFDGIKGIKYGQSFCNNFGIADNILYHTHDVDWCDNYIRKHYIN